MLTNYLFYVNSLFSIISLFLFTSLLGAYENVGQLFVVPVCPTHGEKHIESVSNLLRERQIGGVIFMEGTSQVQKELLQRFEREVDTPLLVFQDGECGLGMRLRDVPNMPNNLTLGAITDLELLKAFGLQVARECRQMGVDSPLSPVVDINSNPLNPVIGSRSFGDDPFEVTKRARAVMEGMQEGGVMACVKHFPGHGDTALDSHHNLPRIDKSLQEMEQMELIPFQALIDQGTEMVMVGHLYYPALSPLPSSLSPEIVTGLLREKMGFEGLIITDALNMRALSDRYGLQDIVEGAFRAGADLLLTATTHPEVSAFLIEKGIPAAIDHLVATIPEKHIEERARRLLQYKNRERGPLPAENPGLRRSLYRHALTAIGEASLVEVSLIESDRISLVQGRPDPELEKWLGRYVRVDLFGFDEVAKAPHPLLINLRKGDQVDAIPKGAILALFDTPYACPDHPNILVAYEDVEEMKEAVADALFGKLIPSGKLPVRLSRSCGQEGIR